MYCCWMKKFDLKETRAAAAGAPTHGWERLTQSGLDWQQVINTVYRKHFMTGKYLICTLLQIVVRKKTVGMPDGSASLPLPVLS